MRKIALRLTFVIILCALLVNLAGCAALQKKFTPKRKKTRKIPVFYRGKKYDIKPSMELYEKHYVFWINWQRKIIAELGNNFKNDIRCMQEIVGNLRDMEALLVDEKVALLLPHIDDLKAARTIIEKRNLTKVNETRIRRVLEREYRVVKREFSPAKMQGFIRKDWRPQEVPIKEGKVEEWKATGTETTEIETIEIE
ncbi:hypothetical protein ACFL3J_02085 [Candidatus Omnitrophota bacterium]